MQNHSLILRIKGFKLKNVLFCQVSIEPGIKIVLIFPPSINKINHILIHQSMNQDHKRVVDFDFLLLKLDQIRIYFSVNQTEKQIVS
jgi:hypothetical protein